jgi:hypothetical protein
MVGLRDQVGRFLSRSAEPPVEGEIAEDDAVDLAPLDPQQLAAEIVRLRDQIEELRAERKALLAAGDIDAIADVDAAIARAEIVRESLGVRLGAAQVEQVAVEHARRVEAWRQVEPRLQAVWAERDRLAHELWIAVDQAVVVEVEAGALVELADRTFPDGPLTRYLWLRWAEGHARRIGLMPRQAA